MHPYVGINGEDWTGNGSHCTNANGRPVIEDHCFRLGHSLVLSNLFAVIGTVDPVSIHSAFGNVATAIARWLDMPIGSNTSVRSSEHVHRPSMNGMTVGFLQSKKESVM